MRFCEQLLMESVRLAQRSITLRKVMKEIQFDCGDTVYTIQPGCIHHYDAVRHQYANARVGAV